ncbi:MAG: hypothetical protein K0Q79_1072 [Flavipsychrobacter sp.]|nr:hypothetical protein [Flavipsychrobacter sp.]
MLHTTKLCGSLRFLAASPALAGAFAVKQITDTETKTTHSQSPMTYHLQLTCNKNAQKCAKNAQIVRNKKYTNTMITINLREPDAPQKKMAENAQKTPGYTNRAGCFGVGLDILPIVFNLGTN